MGCIFGKIHGEKMSVIASMFHTLCLKIYISLWSHFFAELVGNLCHLWRISHVRFEVQPGISHFDSICLSLHMREGDSEMIPESWVFLRSVEVKLSQRTEASLEYC